MLSVTCCNGGTLNICFRKLKYTDEEVERSFEDFYEDVHTEFLKFGEIVNFKVCKNVSSHLRGNVYVHYKSLESAVLAYQSINGRYFAGKLLTCEFVNVMRWRVALCGEYMKSRFKTCSRGSACNFIHCFRNPGGDYEWADWDKPAPRYWLKKMAALFGDSGNGSTHEVSPGYHSRRSRSIGLDSPHSKNFSDEDDGHRRSKWRHKGNGRGASYLDEGQEQNRTLQNRHRETYKVDLSERRTDGHRSFAGMKRSSKKRGREPESTGQDSKSRKVEATSAKGESTEGGSSYRYLDHRSRSLSRQRRVAESVHEHHRKKGDNFEQGESLYANKHHDKFHRHKDEHSSHEKNEADSLNIDSHGDSQDSVDSRHHTHSKKYLRRMKDETESSSGSDESRLVKDEKRQQKKRRKSSRSKDKTRAAEIDCDEDNLVNCNDRQHKQSEKSPREMKNISESADGIVRLDRDGKRPQKNARKSSRLKNQSGFTDTESDRDENRRHRHSKQRSRCVKDDRESSDSAFDGDRLGRREKRSQKSRRISSRSKKESDLADRKSNRERIDEEERHHGHRRSAKHHIKEGLSKVISKNSAEVDAGNCVTDDRCRSSHPHLDPNHHPEQESSDRYHGSRDVQGGNLCRSYDRDKCHDSSYGDLASERDHKRHDEERILHINRSDEEATVSEKVETCLVHTEGLDDEAKAELEKACRHAALKKLEEIRMHKDTLAAHDENMLSRVLEKPSLSEVKTRRRI